VTPQRSFPIAAAISIVAICKTGGDGLLRRGLAFLRSSTVEVAFAGDGVAHGCTVLFATRWLTTAQAIAEKDRGGVITVDVRMSRVGIVDAVLVEDAGANLTALGAGRRRDVQAAVKELLRLGLTLRWWKTIADAVRQQTLGDQVAAFTAVERFTSGEAVAYEAVCALVADIFWLARVEAFLANGTRREIAAVLAGALMTFEQAAFAGALGAFLAFGGLAAVGQTRLQHVVCAGVARCFAVGDGRPGRD
jgi:hypothetical protein